MVLINGVSTTGIVCLVLLLILNIPFPKIQQPEQTEAEPALPSPGLEEPQCFRQPEKERIKAVLKAASSVLVIGQQGMGKSALLSFVANDLQAEGYTVVVIQPATMKQLLLSICHQLAIDTESLEGKALSLAEMSGAIIGHLQIETAFLLCDNAHQLPTAFRRFLEELLAAGVPMLLTATNPPARDIFLKLPRFELQPMNAKALKAIALDHAQTLGISVSPASLSKMLSRIGGVPMLAKRAVEEEYLGLEPQHDHTQWIDGTPYLIAALMVFTLLKLVGHGTGSTNLYVIGAALTIALSIVRLILYSLPRQSKSRLGR